MRFDGEAARTFAALPDLPHFHISGLDVTPKSIGVEQWISETVSVQTVPQRRKQRGILREAQRQSLISFETFRHELGKADGGEQAGGHPSGKGAFGRALRAQARALG